MAFCIVLIVTILFCVHGVLSISEDDSTKPEQIHISYGGKPNHIVVSWLTFSSVGGAVRYGANNTSKEVAAKETEFKGSWPMRFMQRGELKDLEFNTTYVYSVGSKSGWSKQFSFKSPPAGGQWVQRGLMFGDMGVENCKIFTDYKHRFQMPGPFYSMFYSFNLGLVHYVAINTEVYHYWDGKHTTQQHYYWLVKDLEEANRKKHREEHPWIVMIGHRPMYCTDGGWDGRDYNECNDQATRVGNKHGRYKIEPLLKKYGVDLVVWGHEHVYERLWPVYDNVVYNGSKKEPYHNPRAPVHVITGSAGSREKTDLFLPPAIWTAVQCNDYGYMRFEVHNRTHMYLEQVSVEKKDGEKPSDYPKVTDMFWIVQEKHGPFTKSD